MTKAIHHLQAFNFDAAVGDVRVASSEIRSEADLVAATNPEAQQHFLRAADAMDSSSTSLSSGNVADATNWLKQALNEVRQGVAGIHASNYC